MVTRLLKVDVLNVLSIHWQLQGTIPSELSQLTSIERLDVSNNWLIGGIPSSFTAAAFPHRRKFSFEGNSLNGDVPPAEIDTRLSDDHIPPVSSLVSEM